MYGDWTTEVRGHRTQHPLDEDFVGLRTSWDRGLRGIQDFAGFRTLWDLGLYGIQDFVGTWDFVGSRAKQKIGLLHPLDRILVLW